METFSNILVAVDLSENCKPAVNMALKMQSETEADLTLLYVFREEGAEVESFRSMYKSDISADKLLTNVIKPRVKEWLEEIDEKLTEEHEFVVRIGQPGEKILDYAAENKMDLIVTGTHGRSGFKRWWIGSVAERVVRNAECPVLTVRSKGEATDRLTSEIQD